MMSSPYTLLAAFELVKILSLLSTSFIEEQHQTAYFFLATTFLVKAFTAIRKKRTLVSNKKEDILVSRNEFTGDLRQRKFLAHKEKDEIDAKEPKEGTVDTADGSGLLNGAAGLLILRVARTWNQVD